MILVKKKSEIVDKSGMIWNVIEIYYIILNDMERFDVVEGHWR